MITEWAVPTRERIAPRGPGASSSTFAIDGRGVVSPAMPDRWHVLQTRSRQEKAVAEVLHDQGATPFLPVVRRVVHYGHRRRVVEIPVFTNYVFVWGTQDHTYSAMKSCRVVRVVAVADQRTFTRDVEQIRLAIKGEAALSPYRFLERGVRVRIASGPFKDIEGLVIEDPRGTRLVLQIQALGRATSLEIDACLLERVDEDGLSE
jgi:transcription antitermination factor NusG